VTCHNCGEVRRIVGEVWLKLKGLAMDNGEEKKTFEQELADLVETAKANDVPPYQLERIVANFYRRHGRKQP